MVQLFEGIGFTAFLLIHLLTLQARPPWRLPLVCGQITIVAAIACPHFLRVTPSNQPLFLAGLKLYWAGLWLIRMMMLRSVSLRFPSSFQSGSNINFVDSLRSRLQDAKRLGLFRPAEKGTLRLTPTGQILAKVILLVKFLLGGPG